MRGRAARRGARDPPATHRPRNPPAIHPRPTGPATHPSRDKAQSICVPQVLEGCWPVGGVFWRLHATWSRLGTVLGPLGSNLEPSGAILSRLGGRLGLPEALLEPPWAILDAPAPRETPRLGPGEGVRGRGEPLPEGEEGSWKRKRPRPLTPRGLVGVHRIVLLYAGQPKSGSFREDTCWGTVARAAAGEAVAG